jgi:tetratricopeptide (TPR) repeat protein
MEAEKKVIPHRDVVEKLHEHINIALQQSLSGDFQKAISILKYSLEYGKINGVSEYDYDILKIQFMIGSFYYATKKLDIALQTILPAFENLNKRYGNYSIDSSLLFLTVFGIYWDLGQIEEAKSIGMTGLKNIIKIEGKNKPKFKICYDEIYKRYKNAGDEDGMKELQDLHIS